MSLILNIETSISTASICLKNNEGLEDMLVNDNQKDHAGWLHEAIASFLKKNNFSPTDLKAEVYGLALLPQRDCAML